MPFDANEQRQRQDKLRQTDRVKQSQPSRPEVIAGGTSVIRVLLRSVDIVAKEMFFQRLRYATNPPQIGQYEAFGNLERCYPIETAVYDDYQGFVWPAETTNQQGDSVANPITTEAYPFFAMRDHGYWIVTFPIKGLLSLLDPDEPMNPCNFG